MARGSSLSDDNVISLLNKAYIPVDDNITLVGWPDMPALRPWKRWFENHSDPDGVHRDGFTTSVVVTPDGQMALGTSGSGYIAEAQTSVCYRPDKYYAFLNQCLDRYRRLKAIERNANLSDQEKAYAISQIKLEVMADMHDRNRGHEG